MHIVSIKRISSIQLLRIELMSRIPVLISILKWVLFHKGTPRLYFGPWIEYIFGTSKGRLSEWAIALDKLLGLQAIYLRKILLL
jgi:hypothetical protein